MKNALNKLMGAAVFVGFTAVSAGTLDDQANIVQTAAKKPKSSSLASAKEDARQLAESMYNLWKDSNEIAADTRARKITHEECGGINFKEVQNNMNSLKKDFKANLEKQSRLGGLTTAQKKQQLHGLNVIEKNLKDNMEVIRSGCPHEGMVNVSERIADIQKNAVPQERKPMDKADRLGFVRLESADIQRLADQLVEPSKALAFVAKKGNVTRDICSVNALSINKTILTDLMSVYRQSVQAEVNNGGETPANLKVRVDAMQKTADTLKANTEIISKACIRAFGA